MVELKKHQLINKPETIEQFVYKNNKQKPNIRCINTCDIDEINDNNNQDYYQLFPQRKLICEAGECNITATKELKISIGIYGERVFFFCKNCINKFKEVK